MPRNIEIEAFLVARTQYTQQFFEWLESMGVSQEAISRLIGNSSGESIVAAAAKQCYMSFEVGMNPNVTKVRTDMVDYIDNILASGHGSVLEHVNFSFAINGLTRVATAELNRHRAGAAISERSMRYIRFEECIDWWMPLCLRPQPDDDDEMKVRKDASRMLFQAAFQQMENNYRKLLDLWDMDASNKNFHYKKTMTSCFRRIIGMGASTGGVWTYNIRSLRHVLTVRNAKAAEEEINLIASLLLNIMRKEEPIIFGDFDRDNKPKYEKV